MKRLGLAIALTAGSVLASLPASAQSGQGRAIVTVVPSHANDNVGQLPQEFKVKVNGKDSKVLNFTPLQESNSPVELVLLIDSAARSSLGTQFKDIETFVKEMPPNSKMAIAYMENGRAVFSSRQLSSSADEVLKGLHVSTGFPGSNASPYFCLSDLARNWPSHDRTARREVLMLTDGVDNYDRAYDPEDPYVESAIKDSVRAGMVVYSIYWKDMGRANNTWYANNAGQNLLLMVTQATGGNSYWQGMGNPVALQPFLQDLRRRLNHQYELSFSAPSVSKPEVQTLKVDLKVPSAKVDAPQRVFVTGAATAQD